MEEAERLCDRLVIVDHGRVIADDTLSGLHRLVPAANILTIELEDGAKVSTWRASKRWPEWSRLRKRVEC